MVFKGMNLTIYFLVLTFLFACNHKSNKKSNLFDLNMVDYLNSNKYNMHDSVEKIPLWVADSTSFKYYNLADRYDKVDLNSKEALNLINRNFLNIVIFSSNVCLFSYTLKDSEATRDIIEVFILKDKIFHRQYTSQIRDIRNKSDLIEFFKRHPSNYMVGTFNY